MMVFKQHLPGIYTCENLLDESTCSTLLQEANTADIWRFEGGGVQRDDDEYAARIVTKRKLVANTCAQDLFNAYEEVIDNQIKPALREQLQLELSQHWGLFIRRYQTGDALPIHWDNSKPSQHFREYTLMCYLNEDCLGGQTYLQIEDGRECLIDAKIGRGVLFRSDIKHAGIKLHQGEKYVAVAFLGKQAPPNADYEGL